MKKRLSALTALMLCALLLAGCGAAPAKNDPAPATQAPAQTDAPAATPAPEQTPAPTQAPAETPAPTQAPAETPKPTDAPAQTPAPTAQPGPEAVDRGALLAAAEGIYALSAFETEGYAESAADSGAAEWVVLYRSGAADFLGFDADGEWREWRGMPVLVGDDGALRFVTPEDFVAFEMTGELGEDGVLTLSLSLRNPDGSTGGSTHLLERVPPADVDGFQGRKLSDAELAQLSSERDPVCMPFCTAVYACPEEIDWTQVFYTGAGITEEPGDDVLDEYRDAGGWMELDLECVRDARVRQFVWEHTLTSYALASHGLYNHWFDSSDGWYIFEHGDTNAIPVDFYEGWADGDVYRLYYMRSYWENYIFDSIPFVLTVRIRDGQWQYLSNLPADRCAPRTLLTLSYYGELDDARAVNNIVDTAEVAQEDWMEPYDWAWAVFTAQEDGVRYIVETVSDYVDAGLNVVIPGDYVASGVLNAGESAALYTNQPWHAAVRLTATSGDHYASYIFGEDNWMHLNYNDVRRLVGHDLAGEGRGCSPTTEEELSAFLCDGDWALFDKDSGELAAAVRFFNYRSMTFTGFETWFDAFLTFDRYDARPTQAPDLMSMEFVGSFDDGDDGSGLPPGYRYGDAAGDYLLHMLQLDGEQILTLTRVSEGEGVLSAACPEADEGGTFTLHRYKGTAQFEAQG